MTAALTITEGASGWTVKMGDHAIGYVAARAFDHRRPAAWILYLPVGNFGTRMATAASARSVPAAQRALMQRAADWFEAAGQGDIARKIRDGIEHVLEGAA